MLASETIEREFGALKKVKDSYPKYVVSMDDLLIPNKKGKLSTDIFGILFMICVNLLKIFAKSLIFNKFTPL